MWLYIPCFDFDDELYTSYEIQYSHFVQFVYAFLVSRNVQPIKKFYLKCVSSYTSNQNIKVWVNAAIHREVEHLEIKSLPNYILLPSSTIFTCKTIVVMKLNSVKLDAISSACLPSLKVLHLHSVCFSRYSCVHNLLSGCTLLENLVISYIKSTEKLSVIPYDVFTKDLPKLISADVRSCSKWDLLTAFSKAKFLHCKATLAYVSRKRHIPMPIFHNLVHFELHCRFFYRWKFLAEILRNSPNLQILVVKKRNYKAITNEPFVADEFFSPPLLRKCYVGGFEGTENEMQFASFVMKNASILDTITISYYNSSNIDEKFQVLQILSSFPRLSATCQLCFE
ncbi:F-box/FBD/LRR-repeat protein [Senna tora]|uniref:F-box/FBD/LRR-repeat protein n=1 Tax=Senna tora TaxID=362788 RepID=A0A834WJQ5_9FABA|nr:F-box/FBD/LRR-repeat protein [Senna tora]